MVISGAGKILNVSFKGFGKNPGDATVSMTKVQKQSSIAFPDQKQQYNLVHVRKGNIQSSYILGKSISTSQPARTPASYLSGGGGMGYGGGANIMFYDNYIGYSDISYPAAIDVQNGDLFFTSDITGTTSYKIQTTDSASMIDYTNNIINIGNNEASQVSFDYVNNLVNNNGYPPDTIKFTWPNNQSFASVAHARVRLGVQNVEDKIFEGDVNRDTAAKYVFPGQSGFDINNPNILLQLKAADDTGRLYDGRTGDASGWVNDRIREGYREFNVTPYNKRYCWLSAGDSWSVFVVATASINGKPNVWTGDISRTGCW